MSKTIVMAITGASGVAYATRLLEVLLQYDHQVHLVISPAGAQVLQHECNISLDPFKITTQQVLSTLGRELNNPPENYNRNLTCHHYDDLMSSIASGSFLTDAMVICPCSAGTLSAVVHGSSGNLIHRAADVHLKENRPLILVPRETPLSAVHLDNLKRACDVGATVLPAMPGFYHQPRTLQDLIDFVVARICDCLRIEHSLMKRWGQD